MTVLPSTVPTSTKYHCKLGITPSLERNSAFVVNSPDLDSMAYELPLLQLQQMLCLQRLPCVKATQYVRQIHYRVDTAG